MGTALIVAIPLAVLVGIAIGFALTRHSVAVTPIQADPAVVHLFASKRAELQKEAPNASPLPPAELAAALRNMASR